MISYLGVTFDELLQSFEDSFAFSDERPDRLLEEPIELTDESSPDFTGDDEDEEADEEGFAGIQIDADGQLHAYGSTVPEAAATAIDFLTDYIVADQMDESWLPLQAARGALLALQTLMDDLEEIPEVDCAYQFVIKRSGPDGDPDFVTMRPLHGETAPADYLVRSEQSYEGIVNDNTALTELFAKASIPEDEQQLLADIISEAVSALAEEQCAVVLDVKAFCRVLAQQAAAHKEDAPTL